MNFSQLDSPNTPPPSAPVARCASPLQQNEPQTEAKTDKILGDGHSPSRSTHTHTNTRTPSARVNVFYWVHFASRRSQHPLSPIVWEGFPRTQRKEQTNNIGKFISDLVFFLASPFCICQGFMTFATYAKANQSTNKLRHRFSALFDFSKPNWIAERQK